MKSHDAKQFRVLVADDDSTISDLFLRILSHIGPEPTVHLKTGLSVSTRFQKNASDPLYPRFEVITCQQGDEAVDAVKNAIKENRHFSVAFIDIRMPPGPDGIWTAEQIRAVDPNIEIVIFSGYSDIHPRDIASRVPPAHKLLYLQKPFNAQEIYQFAFALSMKWQSEREIQKINKTLEKTVQARTQALRESEKNYRTLAENANDGILIALRDGRHVFANKRVSELTGYHVSELLKTTIKDLANPDEFEMMKRKHNAIISGKPFHGHYETKIIRKNGEKMPVELTCAGSQWQGEPANVVMIRDITRRVKAEDALKKAQNELEHLLKKRTLELNTALKDIRRSEKELSQRKLALEELNKELIETNQALSLLAKNIDRDKERLKKDFSDITLTKIIPIVKKIQEDKGCQKHMADLDLLITYLKGLISGPIDQNEIFPYLSNQEMRVAAMIKRGMTSQKIADMLNVSLHTIKTHRKNIRSKLNLKNSSINLTSYLRSKANDRPTHW